MPYPEVLEGAAGRYERWDPERHTDALAELCADPEVMRYLGGPVPEALSLEMSERLADHWDAFHFGLWAAVDPEDGRVAGFTGACRAAWHPAYAHRTEVGWRLARWSWGRGFATEGGRLALAHIDIPEVIAFVHPQNERSRAVVRRLGMQRARTTTDPNLHHPLDVYTVKPQAVRPNPQEAP